MTTSPASDCSLVFPPHPAWVRIVREVVRALLAAAKRTDLTDTAVVLSSEAVTNAVNACRAGGCDTPVTVLAEWTSLDQLLVLVHDNAPGVPESRRRSASGEDESGRGLTLIEGSADAWGFCAQGGGAGKAMWFTLGAPAPKAEPAWARDTCGECARLGAAQRRAVDSGSKQRAVAATVAMRRHVHDAHPR
ncbi:hypothetical protein BLA24_26715 [Streptomyces cinnamoneus]|uniref:Histidine kinase/HSP90-like ATPase domain-containing protein n=1 Tax=Streptomyces cinnamoneus TaxID=53446 RepID=A0A2G1XEI4_STRCJ|nr:ATP-binding protein [Streptomyces cinnamoneus]PHQ49615.1 hypothetical protein BLA24_26715 [Streptomyces cinnamoneus]PPT14665.1 ATP-binding protein [Streptomyces cinnamoneus]